MVLFGQSLLIGLSIAAPVGQIGVLAIQRTLDHGRAAGLATGLGAAFADAVYGAIGAFGVTIHMPVIASHARGFVDKTRCQRAINVSAELRADGEP